MSKRLSTVVAGLTRKTRGKLGRADLPLLWVMSDMTRLPDPGKIVSQLPRRSAVIVRHIDRAARCALAETLAPLCRARGVKLLISEDWRAAARFRLDGVHMPEKLLLDTPPGLRLWRKAGKRFLTGSAHGAKGLKTARRMTCDVSLLSPVLPSRGYPGRPSLGRVAFAALSKNAKAPVAALGGIALNTVRQLHSARFVGVAGIGFAVED